MSRSCIRAQIVIVTRLQQGSSLCNMLLRGMKDDSGKANKQYSDVFIMMRVESVKTTFRWMFETL